MKNYFTNFIQTFKELRYFTTLWASQFLSALGSAMTSFALIIWVYEKYGSAMQTALLSICTYAPYVLMSIFAGALSDKWNKKITLLVCDSVAVLSTITVFVLLQSDSLEIWHIYCLNAVSGLMNTVAQPSSEVAVTLITPKKHYQTIGGMRALSGSLTTILTPIFATSILAFWGINVIIFIDLITFAVAFICLLLFIKIPKIEQQDEKKESVLQSAKVGLQYLKENKGILHLIFFLAWINLIASMADTASTALILSKGSEIDLGIFNTATGIATLIGGFIVTFLPKPKSRVKVICGTLLFSMSTENFLLAFGDNVTIWSIGAILGWIVIPLMSTNMNMILREKIPVHLQGRVYATRNSLQYFTIPLGYFLSGFLVDKVFEPFMEGQRSNTFTDLFGTGKGSGAACLFFFLGISGVIICLIYRKNKHICGLEKDSHNM